ncbi:MAG: alpha/beta hydrolase [Bacteroidota bacterium]
MKTIYCISGLGADERAFSRLKVEGYRIQCLPWLTPQAGENITDYATRMREAITEENPILCGLSFGGMMSIEISKQIQVDKLILISSIKSIKELPRWMKTCGFLRINRLFPMRSFKLMEPIQNRNLGITTPEEIELVRSYRRNAPQVYMDWAVNQVLNWRNNWSPEHIYHVHGDADRLFPIAKISATHVIKGGGHFMIMNRADDVNAALKEILITT